jgi:bacterioferritin-associated ferredoxin
MLVCHCRGITDRQIRRLVKDGASSAREVARVTGAGMRCGGCRSNVKQVVNDAVDEKFQKAHSSMASEILLPMAASVEG